MFDRVFNMDNGFWRGMTKVADIILLNLLFLLCSIPIITIGASYSALYSVMLKLVKNEESYIFKGFLNAFKENFKQATILWLIFLAVGVFLGVDLYLTNLMTGTVMLVLHYVFLAFFLVFFMMLSYLFPIQSKFENTIKNTIKNSLLMSIAHFPWTVLIVLINAVPFILLLINMGFLLLLIPCMMFFGFALLAFCNSYIFNRIFKKYIPEEEPESENELQV